MWSIAAIGLLCTVDLSRRFLPISGLYGAFDDDFFYYAKIAQNLAHGLGSTLDGIHRTNGYHPLWLLILAGFSAIASLRFLCIAVTLCIVASLVTSGLLCARIAQTLRIERFGAWGIAAVAVFQFELLIRGGMEIVLAIPLLLLLILRCLEGGQRSAMSMFADGLLCSACILARLDSAILVALLGTLILKKATRVQLAAAFATGLMPIAVYAWINQHFFGAIVTSAAAAKQLRLHHGLQFAPLLSVWRPHTMVRMLVAVPGLACALLLVFLTWRINISKNTRAVFFSVGLFPLIQLSLLCLRSDWPLWYWYYYSLALATPFAITLLARIARPSLRLWTAFCAVLISVAAGYTAAYTIRRPPALNPLLQAAYDIRSFERTHPGVYGMGDRSGTVAALLGSPVIQLEGLTMNRDYLTRLRAGPDLIKLLREYAIDYYVSTDAMEAGGCYIAVEPAEAGPSSAHAKARICSQPLATFRHDRFVTRIFAIPLR